MISDRHRQARIIILSTIASLLSLLLAVCWGTSNLSLAELRQALNTTDSPAALIIFELRLPRALSGFACGGLLALAGTLMQILLRNPLADPYILGVSGGASVGALLALFFGWSWSTGGIHLSALTGALCSMALVFSLAHKHTQHQSTRLLLTGVMVASACGAIIALLLSIAPEQQLHGMLFWLMGDLSQSTSPYTALLVLTIGLLLIWPFARELKLLSLGEDTAYALGVNVAPFRYGIYFLASLLTAVAVVHAGAIGFIGLVIPHIVRRLIGHDQGGMLPTAVLAGGTLLTLADTLARNLLAPQQLPVGVLTALLGIPFFLFLLQHETRAAE